MILNGPCDGQVTSWLHCLAVPEYKAFVNRIHELSLHNTFSLACRIAQDKDPLVIDVHFEHHSTIT